MPLLPQLNYWGRAPAAPPKSTPMDRNWSKRRASCIQAFSFETGHFIDVYTQTRVDTCIRNKDAVVYMPITIQILQEPIRKHLNGLLVHPKIFSFRSNRNEVNIGS